MERKQVRLFYEMHKYPVVFYTLSQQTENRHPPFHGFFSIHEHLLHTEDNKG